jgi:hypothetical protein
MIRRVWMGSPDSVRHARQIAVYQGYAEPSAQAHWTGDQLVHSDDPLSVAEQLAEAASTGGADALNLRVHVPGMTPEEVAGQIAALAKVVDGLHLRLPA